MITLIIVSFEHGESRSSTTNIVIYLNYVTLYVICMYFSLAFGLVPDGLHLHNLIRYGLPS